MLRALDIWLPAWLRRENPPAFSGTRHVLLCVCDHFEPFHGVDKPEAIRRVEKWQREFRQLSQEFRDADGAGPRHTFFYPIEQYDSDVVGGIADLCHATGSETEIHLHHDRDTAENLARSLVEGKTRFKQHGLLCEDESGAIRYGFVHGNWALDDSHPEGKNCGVRGELSVLRQTGCYADFTLPSAPNRTQTRTINRLYYAKSTMGGKSHDTGRRVGASNPESASDDELLLVQGPLALNWSRRKYGLLPRIENSDLTAANPPTVSRLQLWMDCHVTVEGRPDWIFVKLHTHGGSPPNNEMLLGEPMRAFHRDLQKMAARDQTIQFHYVTARELVNILHAAEAGHSGNPGEFRDYRYKPLFQNVARG